jgi:hypothetical protein
MKVTKPIHRKVFFFFQKKKQKAVVLLRRRLFYPNLGEADPESLAPKSHQ